MLAGGWRLVFAPGFSVDLAWSLQLLHTCESFTQIALYLTSVPSRGSCNPVAFSTAMGHRDMSLGLITIPWLENLETGNEIKTFRST